MTVRVALRSPRAAFKERKQPLRLLQSTARSSRELGERRPLHEHRAAMPCDLSCTCPLCIEEPKAYSDEEGEVQQPHKKARQEPKTPKPANKAPAMDATTDVQPKLAPAPFQALHAIVFEVQPGRGAEHLQWREHLKENGAVYSKARKEDSAHINEVERDQFAIRKKHNHLNNEQPFWFIPVVRGEGYAANSAAVFGHYPKMYKAEEHHVLVGEGKRDGKAKYFRTFTEVQEALGKYQPIEPPSPL